MSFPAPSALGPLAIPRLRGVGMSLRLGFPLVSAEKAGPLPDRFCRMCNINLLDNAGVRISALKVGHEDNPRVRVRCDCGASSTLPIDWFD